MAEDLISEPSVPAARRFQFRLRSIFILMAIVAFASGVASYWFTADVMQKHFSPYERPSQHELSLNRHIDRIEKLRVYSPGFGFIAFVGCCGVWYACAKPSGRKSDRWLGVAFAISFGFVVFPHFWSFNYLRLILELASLSKTSITSSISIVIVLGYAAAIYSCWLLFLKRYVAAMFLFVYAWIYGWIVVSYIFDLHRIRFFY